MRKLLLIVLSLLVCGIAYAEIGATGYTSNPRQEELGQYVFVYNNSGSDISSNSVVILDTTAANVASGSTLGARIATTTAAGNARVLGITHTAIANGFAGPVCVRGPHKALFNTSNGLAAAGATLATSTTAGQLSQTGANSTSATIAVMLSATQTQDASVDGSTPATEPANLYWVWVGQR